MAAEPSGAANQIPSRIGEESSSDQDEAVTDYMWGEESLHRDVWIKTSAKQWKEPDQGYQPPNQHPYASFGDRDGTTATVNAYGHIMQISRYFGFGTSGLFCVDLDHVHHPFNVQPRMKQLMELSRSRSMGIQLKLGEIVDISNRSPTLGFMYDRWPRFVYQRQRELRSFEDQQHSQHETNREDPRLVYEPFDLSIQYLCKKGTIFQRYLLRSDRITAEFLDKLELSCCVGFTDLDFSKYTGFEQEYEDEEDQDGTSLTFESSYIVARKLTKEEQGEHSEGSAGTPDYISLIIQILVGDEVQKISRGGRIRLNPSVAAVACKNRCLDITVAYRLQLLDRAPAIDRDTSSKVFRVANSSLVATQEKSVTKLFSRDTTFRKIRFCKDPHLDFVIRRNLEHILSVCCIPIRSSPIFGGIEPDSGGFNKEIEAECVAITCGDVSGHRVDSRASLSAVQFMSSILEYLDPCRAQISGEELFFGTDGQNAAPSDEEQRQRSMYLEHLHSFMKCSLAAQVSWICTRSVLDADSDSPHHWPSGRSIPGNNSLSPSSLIDIPLEILKIQSSLAINLEQDSYHRLDDRNLSNLWPKIKKWILRLNESDGRKYYAFPASSNSCNTKDRERPYTHGLMGKKYRLTDHVMICLALRYIHSLDIFERVLWGSLSVIEMDDFACLEALHNRYDVLKVHRKVLKNFTVPHSISKKRILAPGRTSTKTRYLLYPKDTFLFHPSVLATFRTNTPSNDTSISWRHLDQRWRNTVQAQWYHDVYHNARWRKPLWYGLLLILQPHAPSTNESQTRGTFEQVDSCILKLMSPSGLLPGLLGADSASVIFDSSKDRDSYWHTTFELPLVLWNHRQRKHTRVPGHELFSKRRIANLTNVKDPTGIGSLIEKSIQFVSSRHSTQQTRLSEFRDVWLQDVPHALDFPIIPVNLRLRLSDIREELHHMYARPDSDFEEALNLQTGNLALRFWMLAHHLSEDRVQPSKADSMTGIVIDVPKKQSDVVSPHGIEQSRLTQSEFISVLESKRTVSKAKKRIIWLSQVNDRMALSCYLSNPMPERGNVFSFFQRYESHDIYFVDSASAASNRWETELHLSFFRKEKEISPTGREREGPGVDVLRISANQSSDSVDSTLLYLNTMSFRFIGDFCDRFWTCTFLENEASSSEPHRFNNLEKRLRHVSFLKHEDDNGVDRGSWQQRRVLEQLILNEILNELWRSTTEILRWAKDDKMFLSKGSEEDEKNKENDELWKEIYSGDRYTVSAAKTASDSNPLKTAVREARMLRDLGTSENYFSIAENWRMFTQILLAVEDNLNENVETLQRWNAREKDRMSEKPRWTQRDEEVHQNAINKMVILNQRKFQDIERLSKKINAFRESLPNRLESIREDINFRGSQNINMFTYVTVVFLPLGFATGLFSTSGAPDHSTLMNLVTVASIALGATVFALILTKASRRAVRQICQRMGRAFWNWMVRCSVHLPLFLKGLVECITFYVLVKPVIPCLYRSKMSLEEDQQQASRTERQPSPAPESLNSNSTLTEVIKKIMDFSIKKAIESERLRISRSRANANNTSA